MGIESYAKTPLEMVSSAVEDNLSLKSVLLSHDLYQSSIDLDIDQARWNRLYPYALIMAEYNEGVYKQIARYTLPIPPEQLTIQTPYAITVSKTLGGVVEEHNADPFKMIAFTGTTGVNPLRHITQIKKTNNLFGGIIDAAKQTAESAKALFNPNKDPANNPLLKDEQNPILGTGYYQFRLLEIFLASYARNKKAGNKNLRLLFVPFKQQKAYVVTPVQFSMRREAGRAFKYRYDLQFKAWKEFPSAQLVTPFVFSLKKLAKSLLVSALNIINEVRKIILGAISVIKNVRAAVSRLLDYVRQAALAITEAIGAVKSLVLLPFQIIADCKAAFIESREAIKNAWDDLGDTYRQAKVALKDKGEKLSTPSWIDGYFADPSTLEASNFFARVDTSKLNLPRAVQDRIDAEVARVANWTEEDYARIRNDVRSISVEIADAVGASNSTYDATYNNVHATVTRTPTQGDWDVLFATNDFLNVLNGLSQVPSTLPTTMEYVAGFASKSGIAFQVPTSKFAVPMLYDFTLEEMARKYLGNPDRWMEIATLNGLREPYVDEVGFTYALTSNGSMTEITVASDTNLQINQAIWIQSNVVNREKRHIVNIRNYGVGNAVLTLDGNADLDRYTTADSAYIQAFLPYTVNSLQMLYIPSDEPASENEQLSKIPGVDAFDSLIDVGGVDLLLTSDNDLAITDDGDCRMAFGMSNLVQQARLALGTPQGALLRHPEYGLPIAVGMSVADLDINGLKTAVSNIFASDPAFDGTTSVSILQSASTLQIGLGLTVTGQDHPISLTFQVKR